MKCFYCKAEYEDKPTTFMVDLKGCIVIVKGVPSQVCRQCGEVSYSHEVTKALEGIVNSAKQAVTEIAVVNYTARTA